MSRLSEYWWILLMILLILIVGGSKMLCSINIDVYSKYKSKLSIQNNYSEKDNDS